MDNERKKRLFKKGWTWDELKHASDIINQPKDHHLHIKKNLHLTGFWYLLIGLIVLNIFFIIFAIPIIILVPSPWIYVLAIIGGLSGGILFNWLVLEIEHLEHEHHTIALLMIPALTLLDVLIIYGILDKIRETIKFNYNPDPVVFYFGLCFIIPYFIWFILGKHTNQV